MKNIFNDSASALVLMNKLIEEKRYDDVIKVFEYGCQRGFSTTSGRAYPIDVVMLVIEGLYRQVNIIFQFNFEEKNLFLEYKRIINKSKRNYYKSSRT